MASANLASHSIFVALRPLDYVAQELSEISAKLTCRRLRRRMIQDRARRATSISTVIRIAITEAALEAIAATLPLGGVRYEAKLDPQGKPIRKPH